MQSAAGRRAFGFLASKIHPPLPLSPRESAQLLALLTSSFRAHLDSAHPPAGAALLETSNSERSNDRRPGNRQSAHGHSSQASASKHLDSILTNPLFAVRPHSQTRQLDTADARRVLRDPIGWFLEQAALGAATLKTAATCLHLLKTNGADAGTTVRDGRRPGTQIAEWLTSTGLDNSSEFLAFQPGHLLRPLTTILVDEGEDARLWAWFTRSSEERVRETGLEEGKIASFRGQLLKAMVKAKLASKGHMDDGLSTFLLASSLSEQGSVLRPAGSFLAHSIATQSHHARSPELYDAFVRSSENWVGKARAIQPSLWLHHPTKPSTRPAITYIRSLDVASDIAKATPKIRKFLVHMCLRIAHQSLTEENSADAQYALEFVRNHFQDLVGGVSGESGVDSHPVKPQAVKKQSVERKREEEKNLEMLDRLLPT